jgi:hypothetical protein
MRYGKKKRAVHDRAGMHTGGARGKKLPKLARVMKSRAGKHTGGAKKKKPPKSRETFIRDAEAALGDTEF